MKDEEKSFQKRDKVTLSSRKNDVIGLIVIKKMRLLVPLSRWPHLGQVFQGNGHLTATKLPQVSHTKTYLVERHRHWLIIIPETITPRGQKNTRVRDVGKHDGEALNMSVASGVESILKQRCFLRSLITLVLHIKEWVIPHHAVESTTAAFLLRPVEGQLTLHLYRISKAC